MVEQREGRPRAAREAPPMCPLHVGTVMVRSRQGSSLIRYGYQARKPEVHYRCPRGGCPRVAMAENPDSNEILRGNRNAAGRPPRGSARPQSFAADGEEYQL